MTFCFPNDGGRSITYATMGGTIARARATVRARAFEIPSEMPKTNARPSAKSDPATKTCSGSDGPYSPRSLSSRMISRRKRR